MCIYPMTHYHT